MFHKPVTTFEIRKKNEKHLNNDAIKYVIVTLRKPNTQTQKRNQR